MSWNQVLLVLVVSAAPISELRAGIPLALAWGFPPASSFLLALLGNLLPLPFLLWALPLVLSRAERWPGALGRLWRAYISWRLGKTKGIQRYGPWFLLLVVGVPLPGTGLWTGALLAGILGIPPRKAIWPLALGVLLAGLLVLLGSLGVLGLFGDWKG